MLSPTSTLLIERDARGGGGGQDGNKPHAARGKNEQLLTSALSWADEYKCARI